MQKLKLYLQKYKSDNDVFFDLMQFKVREILLVSTIYDAFILEEEDKLTEKIFGEYYQLSLSSAPRITSVTSGDDALKILSKKHFDMVILTMRLDEASPFELSNKIRTINSNIPIFLLLNDNSDLNLLKDKEDKLKNFEKIFVWNRDAKIFLAMIKYLEDKKNVDLDTKIGLVRVILLVEDSIKYYSKYLPILYTEIIKQTQRIIKEEHYDEQYKLFRMRARPKVLIACNYEEAVELFNKYQDYILCVISDVKFPLNGKLDETAGLKLIEFVKSKLPDLPTLLQSSDIENEKEAYKLRSSFINKNSPTLSLDLTNFIFNNLGFGDFVFKDLNNNEIARAKTISEFEQLLHTIPDQSLLYHGNKNHFSAWLMARGEIQIAKKIHPLKVSDFKTPKELRDYLINVYKEVKFPKTKGKVVNFEQSNILDERYIVKLSNGSLGGKGRGIAFINTILQHSDLPTLFNSLEIKIPKTAIIGTEEYDLFMLNNKLYDFAINETDFNKIKHKFIHSNLSDTLIEKLKVYLKHTKSPLAVRSSSVFEDSISQPFSGIYDTFLLPNNSSFDVNLKNLMDAIKLVYASIFSKTAKSYFEAINYKIEEEKMAVVIQEIVGNLYNDRFYPSFSGVAQSYNYYPISYIKPEDGIVIMGVGLGKYVVDGEKAFRFCPKYPNLDFISYEELLDNTQTEFYAINMKNNINLLEGEECTLVKLSISEAEKDGSLDYIASCWDYNNNRLEFDLNCYGPRIINFGHILKYNYIPLAEAFDLFLNLIKQSMGTPVEIEFAVNLHKDSDKKATLYILQIKPLTRELSDFTIDLDKVNKDQLILYTEKGMGNGKIDDIYDLVYVDPDIFDKTQTIQIASEVEYFNNYLKTENRKYILIGPGRWGTRDRWLGIPVQWYQISNAKIIVEVDLKNFKVDPSLGSHFFHNITSLNVGYFTVPYNSNAGFIDWKWLKEQRVYNRSKHVIHLRFNKPIVTIMDGRKSVSLIYKEEFGGS